MEERMYSDLISKSKGNVRYILNTRIFDIIYHIFAAKAYQKFSHLKCICVLHRYNWGACCSEGYPPWEKSDWSISSTTFQIVRCSIKSRILPSHEFNWTKSMEKNEWKWRRRRDVHFSQCNSLWYSYNEVYPFEIMFTPQSLFHGLLRMKKNMVTRSQRDMILYYNGEWGEGRNKEGKFIILSGISAILWNTGKVEEALSYYTKVRKSKLNNSIIKSNLFTLIMPGSELHPSHRTFKWNVGPSKCSRIHGKWERKEKRRRRSDYSRKRWMKMRRKKRMRIMKEWEDLFPVIHCNSFIFIGKLIPSSYVYREGC